MIRFLTGLLSIALLSGCASTSSKTFSRLDRGHPAFHSDACRTAADDTRVHDELKLARMIASPVALVLSGGALLPAVIAANAGLDTADRIDASRMEIHCGGKGRSAGEIATEVVGGAALGIATGPALNAVVPVQLPAGLGPTPSR
ncbi:MAG: hypothetical protein EBR85_00500 [Betaproteobacteria bacterium]|nr:hypothetical protein [Betaproteobacteria bacterium]